MLNILNQITHRIWFYSHFHLWIQESHRQFLSMFRLFRGCRDIQWAITSAILTMKPPWRHLESTSESSRSHLRGISFRHSSISSIHLTHCIYTETLITSTIHRRSIERFYHLRSKGINGFIYMTQWVTITQFSDIYTWHFSSRCSMNASWWSPHGSFRHCENTRITISQLLILSDVVLYQAIHFYLRSLFSL